jgi:hypothetical protein
MEQKFMRRTEPDLPLTMSIPLFGRLVFELGEAKSYEAALRGDIPTMKLGGKKRVMVRAALARVAAGDVGILDGLIRDLSAKLAKVSA